MIQERMINRMMVGSIGHGQKTIVFTEEMFNEKLVPADAVVERFTEKGRKLVRMTYKC